MSRKASSNSKTEKISFRVSSEEKRALEGLAAYEGVPVSRIVRQALNEVFLGEDRDS